VGTRRKKTGIEWKERKEGAEYAMKRKGQVLFSHHTFANKVAIAAFAYFSIS
jgi:hypothetical protein